MALQKIVFKDVAPAYVDQSKFAHSELWNHEISFVKGEKIHVIAASGRGKSSLIHFMYLLRNDFLGAIIFDGRRSGELTPEQVSHMRQSNLSIVFQDLRLFKDQTLWENINIKRILKPYYEAAMIEKMAVRLGIESRLHMQAQKCSYGEQQRAAIIRALMQPFDFILLDEPFSHLDEDNKHIAMELIQEESEKRGAAMIFAGLDEEAFTKNGRVIRM